jgi:Mrp family chromosome partitioning ATPase
MPALEVALEKLRQIPRLLVLVELPSAAVPETVVAAEKLPSVVWLADCNRVRARATKSQMETLRHSRARLVGAVLNHEPRSPLRRRFARANS